MEITKDDLREIVINLANAKARPVREAIDLLLRLIPGDTPERRRARDWLHSLWFECY